MYQNLPIISVADYNNFINDAISPLRFAVKGEISGYRVSQGKWITFDLKDEKSKVACFTTVYKQNIELEDGMEVVCYGYPKIYVPYGRYSFNIDVIDPVGEGALKKAFELTKKKLEEGGLFDDKYKKAIPRFPKSIGLITSEGAAAYTDVLRILHNRWGGLEIYLRPVLVQGVNAPAEICSAFEYYNQRHPVDVIILTRGGGSLEDLQAFNSENVCRAVFSSNIPVICGVGHERDVSLCDYVADSRASTPTNAAEIAVPEKSEFMQGLWYLESTCFNGMQNKLNSYFESLDYLSQRLRGKLETGIKEFDFLTSRFFKNSTRLSEHIHNKKMILTDFKKDLNIIINRILKEKTKNISYSENLLKNISPQGILDKGYSMTYLKKDKKLISKVTDLKWGDKILTKFSDGEVSSIVEKIK